MAFRAKMAALAEQLDDKLDQKLDQAAAATSKLQAAAKARVQSAQGAPAPAAAKPPSPPAARALAPPTPPRPGGAPAVDIAAAAKAFEGVPKQELVGLLAKTNARCREMEMRYAELKGLHQQLLEERRQLVVTKGRSGLSMDAERESVEAALHASYRDKLQELEEAVTAASSIKATLQAESASLSTRLQAEQSARGAAERRAEAAANEVALVRVRVRVRVRVLLP